MKKNNKGMSIIEIVCVLVILTSGIIGTYGIINAGNKLEVGTENKIKAINIAREGIEAVQNIRDTNWIKLSSDYTNCWNTKDYDATCIGNSSFGNFYSGSYTLINDGFKWYLSGTLANGENYSSGTYRNKFTVYIDGNGLTYQTGTLIPLPPLCDSFLSTNCRTLFTRQINITPVTGTSQKIKVESIVQWSDIGKTEPYTVKLETILTNRKNDL
ncbi:MAG: type II secretion system protein [Candidatus Gracilibacteria bacterium]|nr:type II secretion system protein [Candidatus Gracilibacteria bacterium]MDD4531056.1 type II secretion system protein [Candidatus Gracilibacteria bacterium]